MKHSLKDWVFATRFWSLTASSMPALVALSFLFYINRYSDIDINWWYGILGLLGAVIFQVGGNLLNDYFDFKFNVDRKDTHSSRILVDGTFTPKSIFLFGMFSLLVGSIIGIFLLFHSGWHLLWIGILGSLGAYFYNRMKYIALGDLTIFTIYGLLIGLGIVYVATGTLMWQILLVTTPAGLLIVAILHANNTRDILNDRKANIKTQAMLIGLKNSKKYFVFLIAGSYCCIPGLILGGLQPTLSIIALLSLPMAIKCVKLMNAGTIDTLETIKDLNIAVANLVMIFCLLYAAANFISGVL